MEYRCISADCHIDLCWLPHDVFVANATPAMKDRMPYVVQGADGPMWVTRSGLNLNLANGKGSAGAVAAGRKYVPGAMQRTDRMAATGLFADGAQGILRPTTPELRLQDQDRDGIQAEVMYGLLHAGNAMLKADRDTVLEFYRIYNDWLSDFCRYNPQRLVGLASIPSYDADVAANEARRVAKLGLRGLDLSVAWDMVPLWDVYWDPFWQAAAETNLPVHFHTIGPRPDAPLPDDAPEYAKLASKAAKQTGNQLFLASILAAVIHGGALDRFPNVRIVLGESGIGWIPYVLERMDEEYQNRFTALKLKMAPSAYWRRQCRATFQNDQVGTQLLDHLGDENVMWGSDYPHPDGVFPDSQEYIKRQFSHLPSATQRKITCENVGKFYGLISA